jgi:hypothetical protein
MAAIPRCHRPANVVDEFGAGLSRGGKRFALHRR